MRYSLTVVAELLQCQYSSTNTEDKGYTMESINLLDIAKYCCMSASMNTDDTGSAVFLVKQIARQYGVTFLIDLVSNQTMEWVVPTNLRRSREVTH